MKKVICLFGLVIASVLFTSCEPYWDPCCDYEWRCPRCGSYAGCDYHYCRIYGRW